MINKQNFCRSTRRGIRKCRQCQHINGNRAKRCANKDCPLNIAEKESKPQRNNFDCVQLVSHDDTRIYSVKAKDRDPTVRSFVQITDVVLSSDTDGSIINRNAICFVDTCKYDCNDINISCKHVKSASECNKTAEELIVSSETLTSLNISDQNKTSIWDLFEKGGSLVPPVQKINKSTFVIKCNTNASFPAGRLHVTVTPDDFPDFSFSCACKKLRILLSPNNSIVLENETCDHLLLLVAGFLGSKALQTQYQKFMDAMNPFWVTDSFVGILNSNLLTTEDFISFSENILNSCIGFETSNTMDNTRMLENDPNLRSKENPGDEDEIELVSAPTEDDSIANYEDESLELAECQIELMDQFKLTNQIDLCNDDIDLPEANILYPVNQIENIRMETINKEIEIQNVDDIVNITNCSNFNKTEPNRILINIEPTKQEAVESNLEFNNWLEYVIEKLNSSLEFNASSRTILNTFDVKNDFFTYLSRKFRFGDKRRLPNSTKIFKTGKYKGLTSLTWAFTTPAVVKKIFSTDKISIQLEKEYMEKSPGKFIPYKCDVVGPEMGNKKLKKILPTVYKVFILIEKSHGAFIVEWIPDVYSKSHFGLLRIQYTIGFKKNNKLIEIAQR